MGYNKNTKQTSIMAYLKLRGNKWYAVWTHNGKKVVKATGIDATTKANKKLAQATADAMEAAAVGSVTLNKALDAVRLAADALGMGKSIPTVHDYLSNYKPAGGVKNASNHKRAIALFLDFLSDKKALRLDLLTPAICREFCQERLKQVSFATVDHNISLIKAALNTAVKDGIIDKNPFSAFSLPSLAPANQRAATKRLPFTPEEMHTIIHHFPYPWNQLALTSLLTGGQRLGDVCCLEWSSVDLQNNIITFNTNKTGKLISVPILPPLRNLLDSRYNESEQYVFPDIAQRYFRSQGALSVEFSSLLKLHGIVKPQPATTQQGNRRPVSPKSFHSIRHTVVTLMRSSNQFTADFTRELVGHDSEEIERQYFTASIEAKGQGLTYLFNAITKSEGQ